ncbi:Pr6Pr family membrane protein [Pseudoclavibacter sp. RFBA6]|uniref:Pr6Pr family membrane protein n=1 Tax=Pseudoclavibacter sp. RFBA6 TaxID=2080573 RepID=UPI000CE890E1|nr:Pr6Pr family membrane protein [Pseudoclavibacter sp. RFBA6]PPG39270.1 hypothetical protein C5C17_10700 [Pseudoclavibacter sp. RFBA6]
MTGTAEHQASTTARRVVGVMRIGVGLAVISMLASTYVGRIGVGDSNPFDFFGYFTNQTSLIASGLLIAAGVLAMLGRDAPAWLAVLRGVATSCMIIVGVIYNTLVPGTGSAPPWVSAILHVVFPAYIVLDWLLVGDRPRLPWNRLWVVLPYPLLWMLVVLLRGATDGWVPYGFLLPEHGPASLFLHVAGLLGALLVAAVLVWWASRFRGYVRG